MISDDYEQLGLSLIEMLIAMLLMSITILGLLNIQSILLAELDRANKQLYMQQIAFQILDVYPEIIPVDLPNGWQHRILAQQYNPDCLEVKVIIQSIEGNSIITQERLFCQR